MILLPHARRRSDNKPDNANADVAITSQRQKQLNDKPPTETDKHAPAPTRHLPRQQPAKPPSETDAHAPARNKVTSRHIALNGKALAVDGTTGKLPPLDPAAAAGADPLASSARCALLHVAGGAAARLRLPAAATPASAISA